MGIVSRTGKKLFADFYFTAAAFAGTGPFHYTCYDNGARFAADVAAEVLSHAADEAIGKRKTIEQAVSFEGFISDGPTYYSEVAGTLGPKLAVVLDRCEKNKVDVRRYLYEGSFYGPGPRLTLKFTPSGCQA